MASAKNTDIALFLRLIKHNNLIIIANEKQFAERQ